MWDGSGHCHSRGVGDVINLRPPGLYCWPRGLEGDSWWVGVGFPPLEIFLLSTATVQSPWDHSVWVRVIPFHSARLLMVRQGIWVAGMGEQVCGVRTCSLNCAFARGGRVCRRSTLDRFLLSASPREKAQNKRQRVRCLKGERVR